MIYKIQAYTGWADVIFLFNRGWRWVWVIRSTFLRKSYGNLRNCKLYTACYDYLIYKNVCMPVFNKIVRSMSTRVLVCSSYFHHQSSSVLLASVLLCCSVRGLWISITWPTACSKYQAYGVLTTITRCSQNEWLKIETLIWFWSDERYWESSHRADRSIGEHSQATLHNKSFKIYSN